MSVEELSEAVRLTMRIGNHVWEHAGPDVELATQILDDVSKGVMLYTEPSQQEEGIEEFEGQAVFGTDSRRIRRDNTFFPMSAQVFTGGCSATMIGESLAVTAAHCVWAGAYRAPSSVSPGSDSQDAIQSPFGDYAGCPDLAVVMSTTFQSGRNTELYDWAVIDFSRCPMTPSYPLGSRPGLTIGYMGTTALPDYRFGEKPAFVYGYPVPGCAGGCMTPSIWGIGGFNYYPKGGSAIRHTIDTTPGQSGSGIYTLDGAGSRSVIGIHKGDTWSLGLGHHNRGRRITNGLLRIMYSYVDGVLPTASGGSGGINDYRPPIRMN